MWRVQRHTARAAAFLLVAVLVATGAQGKKYCNDLECPDYKVVDDLGSGVQLRRYDAATWATTDVDDRSYEKATTLGFHRLFRYIIGDNELEQRIDMTAPVVTTIRLDDHKEFTNDYSVSFFLPYEYQCSKDRKDVRAPKPHDDRVKLVDLKRFDAYVLTFDGYALGFRVKRLAEDLFDFLDRKGCRDYSSRTLFVATYDPPFKIIDRRNEIWLLRKGRKDEQPDVATA